MTRVAIIGSGPTGIYTLKGLVTSPTPLSITIFEETPDAGKGTPYHPAVNDRAMLANIASIELPPIEQSLVQWLRSQSVTRLQELGIGVDDIGEREFYPRVVLGEFFASQFWALVSRGLAAGHTIDVKPSHRILDIRLNSSSITLSYESRCGDEEGAMEFDHVVMATGHDWPENTETSPGYFSSPWPASAIKRIGAVGVGILGTSLSGIDAVVSVSTAHGMFLRDEAGTLRYEARPDAAAFHMTMMSRKGLLPEADFYCPIPYMPLRYCTKDEVQRLIVEKPDRLLDEIFELFKRELADADPDYAARTGIALATVEDIADRYFAARVSAEPFAWAARNLSEAKQNKQQRVTVEWRYAILRMHEVIALAVPHFSADDLKRFHEHFKTVFVDDYATVPHESVERLLALRAAGKLDVLALGDDYEIERSENVPGVTLKMGKDTISFAAFIDATGQHALSASDLPFPSLRQPGALQEAMTNEVAADGDVNVRRTGGIDIDDEFRPRVSGDVSNRLYCVSVPFLLHKLPFVQGITSAHEMGVKVSKAIIRSATATATGELSLIGAGHDGVNSAPTAIAPSPETAA
ncbi:FAD/NAD(P)-binding protein [Neorhizobium alkalisoli]|uniref:Putative NAD(P)/FAD-binding protein YdhS n=1 Tax=Neorhizobium alkalisoli TaxID=528178 RepID=A0A561QGK8_9HYPH|nr:FAD/NAD(P)-binding protein [Neorhizobium alkalisoli]TWF49512.1 putative NAD(P)/FAD-binding protein YdhS [Neorhizobium alkalisoli]